MAVKLRGAFMKSLMFGSLIVIFVFVIFLILIITAVNYFGERF